MVFNQAPDISGLIEVSIIAMCLLAFSLLIFRKGSPEMVDQL
jgi:hypothetical protein